MSGVQMSGVQMSGVQMYPTPLFYWVQSLLGNIIMSLSFGTFLGVLIKNKFLPLPNVVSYILYLNYF